MIEKTNTQSLSAASIAQEFGVSESGEAHGTYHVVCRDSEGNIKWEDDAENIVVNVGKNYALDGYLQTAVTITGPYMFLAGGTPASAAATDTMASKTGWTEVGNANAPAYKTPNSGGTQIRPTCAWSAASAGSKSLSSALTFYMTSGGTVAGCGIVLGTGAVSTIDSTAGILYSVGVFTGGSKTVTTGDTLSVTYTASL